VLFKTAKSNSIFRFETLTGFENITWNKNKFKHLIELTVLIIIALIYCIICYWTLLYNLNVIRVLYTLLNYNNIEKTTVLLRTICTINVYLSYYIKCSNSRSNGLLKKKMVILRIGPISNNLFVWFQKVWKNNKPLMTALVLSTTVFMWLGTCFVGS
jgi:hypothetical protein